MTSDVSRILERMHQGEASAAESLLPLVYDELRKLAAAKLAKEQPGHTLQATALVHEAYLRLVDSGSEQKWDHRGQFFAVAAEAMRRILIDRARQKATLKSGGKRGRLDLDSLRIASEATPPELLALNDALVELEEHDKQAAELVKMRFFSGLTHQEAAEALGITRRAADRLWALSRAWLYRRLTENL